jgi:hypothetical protein
VSRLLAQTCSEVVPAPVAWLWEPYLARGKLAVLDGDPGVGKSFALLDLAARLSRGGPLPDGRPLDRPHVTLMLSAEDAAADTLRPRAEAAGADLDLIVLVRPGSVVRFPDDMAALEDLALAHRPDLIVLDPLAAFVPPALTASHDPSVRAALAPLAALAEVLDCAVVLVRHLTKAGGPRSLYRGLGSIGITGVIRTGLLIARHPDDPALRVFTQTKSNVGRPGPTLGFRFQPTEGGHAALTWTGPLDLSADEVCGPGESPAKRPRQRAVEWLRAQLANGPRKAADVIAAATAAGIAERTLDRVKKDLRVQARQVRRDGQKEWEWSDPALKDRVPSFRELIDEGFGDDL